MNGSRIPHLQVGELQFTAVLAEIVAAGGGAITAE